MNPKATTPPPVAENTAHWGWRAGWGFALVVVVFAAVRWAGMSCDLWLDEIWSLGLVREVKAPWEILTKVHHDNNHPLNSLWLSLLPAVGPAWTYRLLAWFTGSATVLLAGVIARRQYRSLHPESVGGAADAAGLLTAVLIGGAHLLVHYSSEARGYAPAVAAGLLAWYALSHAAGRNAGRWAVVYAAACMLGLLSHLVMMPVMAAAVVWSVLNLGRDRSRWPGGLKRLAVWHAVPWLFFSAYYWGFVRRLSIGGGPENPLAGVLGDVAAFTLGFPAEAGRILALPLVLGVAAVALALIWRRDRTLAALYGLAAFVLPAVGPGLGRFTLLFPRYFIVSAVLVLLLAGYVLARLWARGGAWRWATLGLVVLFLAGNARHSLALGRDGRGQYQAALRLMVEQTPTPVVSVCSDSDFRNGALVGYHAVAAGLGRKIRYLPADRVPRSGTPWLIIHRLDGGEVPPEAVGDAWGHRYELEQVFPHAPLSGWDWFLYRRR